MRVIVVIVCDEEGSSVNGSSYYYLSISSGFLIQIRGLFFFSPGVGRQNGFADSQQTYRIQIYFQRPFHSNFQNLELINFFVKKIYTGQPATHRDPK